MPLQKFWFKMKPLKITLNKTSYTMKFGIACLMQLGKLWQTDTINETTAKIAILENVNTDISFEVIQVITDLVAAAIYTDKANDLSNFDDTDIADVILNDTNLFKNILLEFMQSMPQASGKPMPTLSKKVGTKKSNK